MTKPFAKLAVPSFLSSHFLIFGIIHFVVAGILAVGPYFLEAVDQRLPLQALIRALAEFTLSGAEGRLATLSLSEGT